MPEFELVNGFEVGSRNPKPNNRCFACALRALCGPPRPVLVPVVAQDLPCAIYCHPVPQVYTGK